MTHDAETVKRVKNAIGSNAWGKDWPPHQTETLVHDMYERMARAAIDAMQPIETNHKDLTFRAFQSRVWNWVLNCFGVAIAICLEERNHRFLEEALELVQSLGCTKHEAQQLVDYVYGREIGDPPQEVGGVLNTLAALCNASKLDMADCGSTEMLRVEQPAITEKIRAKQKAKPKHSPLPSPLDQTKG